MIMRLFEGDVRADSITALAGGANFTTHASNFSLVSRSAAFPDITTLSIPNCRKQSTRSPLAGSFRSTKAARAAAFRPVESGVTDVPKALSIGAEYQNPFCSLPGCLAKANKDNGRVPRCHYRRWTAGTRAILANSVFCAGFRGVLTEDLYSVQRRNSKAPFVPPNPNEFERPYSKSTLRA